MSFLAESYSAERGNTTGLNKVAGEVHTGWCSHRKIFFFLSSPCVAYQSSYWLNEHRKKHVFFLGPESKCGLGVQGLLPVQSARVVGPTSCQLSFSSCVPGPINCILHSPVISPCGNLVLMAYKMGGTGPYGNTLCCRGSSVALHKGP